MQFFNWLNEALARLFVRERLGSVNLDNNAHLEGSFTTQKCCFEALEKYDNIISKVSKKCQICEFEGRRSNRYKNVLICGTHGIRACEVARVLRSLESIVHSWNERARYRLQLDVPQRPKSDMHGKIPPVLS